MSHEMIAILPGKPSGAALPEGLIEVVGETARAILAPAPGWQRLLSGGAKQAAIRHHARLEALLTCGPVLPFRIGVACSRAEAALVLELESPLIARLAAEIGARRHYQLTLDWEEARVLEHFRASPELAPLFTGPPVTPEALRDAVSALAKRLRDVAQGMLRPALCDPLEQPRGPGSLLNLVFLIAPGEEAPLEAALESIDALWPEGFRLRLVGPSAPISHALLDLDRADASALQAAARCLDLPLDGLDAARIALAHRHALRRPDLPANEADQIRHAARLLMQGCRAAALGLAQGAPLPLLRHLRENTSAALPEEKAA